MAFPPLESDRSGSAHDELVVLQLLEEIHQLVRPSTSGAPPSALRLQAAAKLYLDTRDTFEVIERCVEGPAAPDRPKFLRKLSKRRGINQTPRQSVVLSPDDSTRSSVEAAVAGSSSLSPRSPSDSRRSSTASDVDMSTVNEATVDRIQDLFRHLGELLSRAILDEVRHRNLTMQSTLHYVRFLPPPAQWAAYVEKREHETRLQFHPSQSQNETILQQLKRHAEFVKEQIRKDVNTVCLFAPDGTLSTIFGDDVATDSEAVADKFDVLIRDVYAHYLVAVVDAKMDRITAVSDQWQQDMSSSLTLAGQDAPLAQLYTRARKFRAKIPIFPHTITALDERSASLPPAPPGQQTRILVADATTVGIWWQKAILAATDRDITTVHTDDSRGIAGVNASLDGLIFVPLVHDSPSEFLKRYARNGGLAKLQGHRVLVNNSKDSLWVEVTVTETEDNKRCKLQLKKSLQSHVETSAWRQLLASNDWLQLKDLRLCLAPRNPSFRVQMGVKFCATVDVYQSLVTEISSIFPNELLERRVAAALWQAAAPALSRGEHIYARYFRSVLNLEPPPRRSATNHNHASERASSIVMATASVRNLVAALDQSSSSVAAATNASSSDGGPTPSSQPQPPPSLTQRRLSLGSSALASSIGKAVELAFFDDKGAYHHESYQPADLPLRRSLCVAPSSPFEKLAHQLLEEMELMGACIQHHNVALARAFAQVLQEKLTRLAKQTQARLASDTGSALETVVAEYAHAARFLYTWHIVRYQLNTVARQQPTESNSTLHVEWVHRSFQRMEALASTVLELQLQHVQRVFFHECVAVVAAGVGQQHWTAPKPWFNHSRCTPAVQFVVFRLQQLMDETVLRELAQYERGLGVHEKLHELAAWLLLDLVTAVAALYETLVVSRARLPQWKMDALYFVTGVHKLLRLLDKMLSGGKSGGGNGTRSGAKTPATEVRERCLRLLTCVAVRCGPADVVAEELVARAELSSALPRGGDSVTELEAHLTAMRMTLGLQRQTTSTLKIDEQEDRSVWLSHSVFGALELKLLADVNLSWASLIARSSVGLETMLASLLLRHELGDWEFPPLTDEQLQHRTRLLQCVELLRRRVADNAATESDKASESSGGKATPTQPSQQLSASFRRSTTSPALLPNHPIPADPSDSGTPPSEKAGGGRSSPSTPHPGDDNNKIVL